MPVTSRTPLGAPTHVRKWYFDVADIGSSSWLPVMATHNTQFNPDNPTNNDVTDNDAGGFKSNSKDAATWMAQFNVWRKTLANDPTSYDPGQEFIRTRSIGKFGIENTFQVRIYEMEPSGPRVEAYLGVVNSSWQPGQGAPEADEDVQVMLQGNGPLLQIAHPDTGSAVPTVSGVSGPPAGFAAAGGDAASITGNRFTGVLSVHFGATAATSFHFISDGLLAVVAPAHATGVVAVTVTNAAGVSTVTGSATYI